MRNNSWTGIVGSSYGDAAHPLPPEPEDLIP